MHSKSSGAPSTCYKYVDSFCRGGCGRLPEKGDEGILEERK